MDQGLRELRPLDEKLCCDTCGKKLMSWDEFNAGWLFAVNHTVDHLWCPNCIPKTEKTW